MTAWNHQAASDHLRRRAEAHLSRNRSAIKVSAASMGHRRTAQSVTQPCTDVKNHQSLSEMSSALTLKK